MSYLGYAQGSVCSAINCTSNKKTMPHLSFFRFPRDPERSRKWQVNCGRKDLFHKDVDYLANNNRLCALHFEQNQFMNELRNRLVWNAVPTLLEISNKPTQLAQKRKRLQTRKVSKAKKLFPVKTATNLRKTSDSSIQWCIQYKMESVECKVEIEETSGTEMLHGPQMLEAVELNSEPPGANTETDVVDESQMFEAVETKVEPPEDDTRSSEPQMFVAVEVKVEPPEDDTRSGTVSEPQVFEFVAVKTEPCKENPESTEVDSLELQAPAPTAKGAKSRKLVNEDDDLALVSAVRS